MALDLGDCTEPTTLIYLPENDGVAPVSASGATAFMIDDGFNFNHESGVTCHTVEHSDGSFDFGGTISFDRPKGLLASVNCTVGTAGATCLGGVQVSDSDLPVIYGTNGDHAAQVEVIELEPGRFLGRFTVPEMPNFDDTTLCATGVSYFAFENCRLEY